MGGAGVWRKRGKLRLNATATLCSKCVICEEFQAFMEMFKVHAMLEV
jgi:hypothetical protein